MLNSTVSSFRHPQTREVKEIILLSHAHRCWALPEFEALGSLSPRNLAQEKEGKMSLDTLSIRRLKSDAQGDIECYEEQRPR